MIDKTEQRPGALSGVTVLDFTRVLAGPYCTMQLGDLGAEIVKVENPKGGDDSRAFRPPAKGDESSYFLAINRNKKSIALNMASPEGRQVARDLADRADVVVENFSAGIMQRFGLDYDSLTPTNPGVIYCSISGYGRDGPFAARAGYDPVIQAESGLMAVTGDPAGEPMRMGVSLIDIFAGMFASQAILGALYSRKVSGRGQRIDVPLFDSASAVMIPYASGYLTAGVDATRFGNSSPVAQPVGTYSAADGPFMLTVAGDAVFRKLCLTVLKRPDLPGNPEFATNEGRVNNKDRLNEILNGLFAGDDRGNWIAAMRAAGVPAGPIRTIAEAMQSEEMTTSGLIRQAPHASLGAVPVVGSPMRLGGTPVRDPAGAPVLGQHSREILRDMLGYDDDRVAALAAAGTILLST
ncbi:MAG: CoA transferase [Alphaproteobacteria bacterium]